MLRNRLYYQLKPFLPRTLRLALRRAYARRVRRSCNGSWPILASAGRKPDGWPGWPNGKQFALVLTHDVESEVGLKRVRRLAELEDGLGFRSAFYFIPEGSYHAPDTLRSWLTSHGFEVGVHDHHHDGKLFSSRRRFELAAGRINAHLHDWGAVGFRSGFMLHNLDWIGDLDIQYDGSTFDTDPFEPQPDGVGTVFPFWVPRPQPGGERSEVSGQKSEVSGQKSEVSGQKPAVSNQPLLTSDLGSLTSGSDLPGRKGYVELPTTLVQDFNLFVILREKSADIWKRKTRWIAERGGMVLLNVHPDYLWFENHKMREIEYRYVELLQWLELEFAGAYWHALPREVAGFASASHLTSSKSLAAAQQNAAA